MTETPNPTPTATTAPSDSIRPTMMAFDVNGIRITVNRDGVRTSGPVELDVVELGEFCKVLEHIRQAVAVDGFVRIPEQQKDGQQS